MLKVSEKNLFLKIVPLVRCHNYGRAGQATDDKSYTCWIAKAKNTETHSEYVIFTAFPQQQWLRERA